MRLNYHCMKKYILLLTTILFITTSFAQQTPQEIASELKSYTQILQRYDNGFDSVYHSMNQQIQKQSKPENRAIWHSCLAQFLFDYYQQNRWKIMNRTRVEGEIPDDPNVWDVQTLMTQAIYHYQQSLQDERALMRIPIKDYKPILDSVRSEEYRPTLYDFLAFRFLDFLLEANNVMPVPEVTFDINNPKYWSDNKIFTNIEIDSPDEFSTSYLALKTMKTLTQLHLKDSDPRALLDVSLYRLDFLANHSTIDNKLELQLAALEELEKSYRLKPGYEMITFALGEYYYRRADKYKPEQYPEYKMDYHAACEWFKKTVENANAKNSVELPNATFYLEKIHDVNLVMNVKDVVPAKQPILINARYKNCEKLHVRIIPISKSEYDSKNHYDQFYSFLIQKKYVYNDVITLPEEQDFRNKSGIFMLPALEKGTYVVMVSNNAFSKDNKGVYAWNLLTVSNIAGVARVNDNKMEVLVYEPTTGYPVSGAEVIMRGYQNYSSVNPDYTVKAKTDKEGRCFLLKSRNSSIYRYNVVAKYDDFEITLFNNWNPYYNVKVDTNRRKTAVIFTDRSIYRPGQTVYYKGIVIERTEVGNKTVDNVAAPETEVTVTLVDDNQQKVEINHLVTNQYGSFSGSFVLPTSGLTGSYTIRTTYGFKIFNVEEYKRPTFEVKINQPEKEFKVDQPVAIDGEVNAYAGYGLDGATVKYHVSRSASFPWWRWSWWLPSSSTQEIAKGEVVTDSEGHFHFDFIAQPDMQNQRYNPLYTYNVIVQVVDITGETHDASTNVYVSDIGLKINMDIPSVVATNDPNEFDLKVVNLAGKAQKGSVHYEIQSLSMPDEYMVDFPSHDYFLSDSAKTYKTFPYIAFGGEDNVYNWKVEKTIASGDFVTDGSNAFSIPNLNNFKEGKYKITCTTFDKDSNEVLKEKFVTIYNPDSKKCPAYSPLWITSNPTQTLHSGDEVTFTVGTYLRKAKVLCEIIVNEKLVESKWVDIDRGKTTLSYKTKPNEYGNVICNCFIAQNSNHFSGVSKVSIPHSELKIDFDFLSFRDKTTPGSQEEYIIRLKNERGEKVAAEMLCTMYDASLDALGWTNSLYRSLTVWDYGTFNYDFQYSSHKNYTTSSYARNLVSRPYKYSINRTYPHLRYHFSILDRCYFANDFSGAYVEDEVVVLNVVEDNIRVNTDIDAPLDVFDADMKVSAPLKTAATYAWEEACEAPVPSVSDEMSQGGAAIRTNFSETAFFYPHLKTDEDGNVLISFTMPESLTKWYLQGFAHDAWLKSGYFSKYVQTSKKLMVVPNAPRFLREGDTLRLSAKVVNMDSITQCGNVTLTFRNALNNVEMPIVAGTNQQPFEVKPGNSQEVSFMVIVPRNVSALTYRIVATNLETPAFSDGEEATLPVLTNRILVTESMQLHISGKGHKSFTFNRFKNSFAANASNTLTTQSLTLEFTPNPIWYAIQAMPYLMEYPYECNEQVFSRYYANALAANIVNKHPRVKEVFDKWLNDSSSDVFCSQLEKNQELKSILLEETPWVMDAQNESVRKQNIALLFDLQRMAKEGKTACKKLDDRQNKDGGWSWFEGGMSSEYITEHILAGFGHLKVLNVPTDLKNKTLNSAVEYIDHEMNDYYQKWIKKEKISSSGNIHYMYARSFFLDKVVPEKYREAYNYFFSNLKKNWAQQSIYMKGMIALVCYRNGDQTLAKQIVANIKSLAQYDEEMGMFWKKSGYGYFWYEAPIERQALLIEAFNTITKDEESVEKMQLWLLKQKQTQSWPTTKSTTEAIYALLLNNDQLDNAGGVKLSLGDWTYTEGDGTEQAEAGSGYIKKSWKGADATANMATINIDKQTSGPAWGGLYWQYLENLDKVEHSQDKELSIFKKLYKVTLGDRGEQLTEITEKTPLKVGDKVRVRVEIRTDRDMEYVHLKDMRASCFEPTNVLSGYKHQDGLWYYESTRDAATNFFIDYLPKGTYVFEYTLTATMAGTCSNGLTTIQCMYAPEFTSHSEGFRVTVKEK